MPRSSTSFKPGQSGNPGGRKSKRTELETLLDKRFTLARRQQVIDRLIDDAVAGEMESIKLLLAYAYGKPVERKEISGPDGASIDISVTEVVIERPVQPE